MQRQLRFTREAEARLNELGANPSRRNLHKQVLKTLGLLELNTRHSGLHTHEYQSLTGAKGERLWEAYVQNDTPGAYRIFFHYGPDEAHGRKRGAVITIVTIAQHPR